MIHDLIFLPLKAALEANGVPFEILYGPTQVPLKVGASRVQMLRDVDGGDQMLPTRSQRANPRQYGVRALGYLVRIFARATVAGAQRHDHEDLADDLADQVLAALPQIVRNAHTEWRSIRQRFVTDLATSDGWDGVVYELAIQIDRGVRAVTFVGDKAPEGSASAFDTTLDTSGSPGAGRDLPSASTPISTS